MANLTNINYPSSPDVQFAYDALNRVTNMVDAAGTTKYAYTAGGQLWTEDGPRRFVHQQYCVQNLQVIYE